MRDSGNLENKVLSAKEGKKTQYVLYNLIYPYKILFVFLYVQEKRNTKTNNNNGSSSNNKNREEMITSENREKSPTKLPQGINVQ